MRISSAEMFRNGVSAIQQQQVAMARTQQQLSTGKRILSPADDPGGAVQALKFRTGINSVEQFTRNADLATSRLSQEETVLTQMGDALQRVRELTVRAANATETNESRAAIAREIEQLAASLFDAANTRDASGEYLFAGYRSGSQPFVRDAAGNVEYLGDSGQRRIAISENRTLPVGDSGDLFMTIPRGNGVFVASAAATNTGTARVTSADVIDPATAGAGSFTIEMIDDTDYQVLDGDGVVIDTGTYQSGQAIDIDGQRILITGAPAAGDRFDVEPAGRDSLFSMVENLAATLRTPGDNQGDAVQRNQATDLALQNLDQALERLLGIRTDVGSRLNAIDSQINVNEDRVLQLETALSKVEDLDYAEAISRFQLQQVALQAAQQTYVQMNRLSLFDYLR